MDENVPRNARMLVPGTPSNRFALRARDGSTIPLVTEPSTARGLVWVRASELLPVRAEYDLESDAASGSPPARPSRISVVGYEDRTPPTAQGIKIASEKHSANCKSSPAAATLQIDWLSDVDNTEGYTRFYVLLDVTIEGKTETAVFRSFGGALLTQVFGADNGCLFARTIQGARPGPASARVTVMDQAGNAVSSGPLSFELATVDPFPCPTRGAAGNQANTNGATSNIVATQSNNAAVAPPAAGAQAETPPTAAAASSAGGTSATTPEAATNTGCGIASPRVTTPTRMGWLAMLATLGSYWRRARKRRQP